MVDESAVAIHSAFDAVEEEFQGVLEVSLNPRGPESLYDLVASFHLPPGSNAVDVGCGRGEQAIELAERFGFDVLGIDPVARYDPRAGEHVTRGSVAFQAGTAEAIPAEAESIDLVFCRESLMFTDIRLAVGEFARVLRPGGQGLVYLVLTGPFMDDREAAESQARGRVRSQRPADIERALSEAGLAIGERVDFQGEWGERQQEETGEPGRRLLYISRLLRQPDRYIQQFGSDNYDIMLGDCFWHVYRLIGKLTGYACTFAKG
jgi:SAM-dependent methyltransferase